VANGQGEDSSSSSSALAPILDDHTFGVRGGRRGSRKEDSQGLVFYISFNIIYRYQFPQFPEEDGPGFWHQIIPFLYQVTQHCVGFSVYIPQLHTLQTGDKLGAWYQELPFWAQRQILFTCDNLLAQTLCQKLTNLSGHKRQNKDTR